MAAFTSTYFTAKALKTELDKPADASKKARQRSAQMHTEAKQRAGQQQADIAQKTKDDRRQRLTDIARNKTRVASPTGTSGQAETIRKTLTGQ